MSIYRYTSAKPVDSIEPFSSDLDVGQYLKIDEAHKLIDGQFSSEKTFIGPCTRLL